MQVIFGAGALGQAVMSELLNRGKQVRVVNRSAKPGLPSDVEVIVGDASDPHFCASACKGAEVIYQCIGLPYEQWSSRFPVIQHAVIEGAAASGAKLIFADNLYAYGPHQEPLHESLANRPVGPKTSVRAQLSQMVLDAHRDGKIRAAIGRGSDFYGPQVRLSLLGERVFRPALSGKPAELIGSIDLPHTHIYIDDFAWGLVTLSEHEDALGQIWHIPAANTLTTRQLVEMIYRHTGYTPKYRIANGALLKVMGWFVPFMREFQEIVYMLNQPFVVDHSKFQDAFGLRVTPHEEAIRRTIEWYENEAKT